MHPEVPSQQSPAQAPFKCTKCACTEAEYGELRAAGGVLSKLFDVQNQKYQAVTCSKCRLTEFYKATKSGVLGNVLDFFTN